MIPGLMVVAGLVTNYVRHRLGLETICQFIREHVPKPVAIILVAAGFSWFVPHLLNGYPSGSGSGNSDPDSPVEE